MTTVRRPRPSIRRRVVGRLLPAVLCLAATEALADATGTWLVDETGVKFDTTLSKIPLLGKVLGTNAARENVAWLISREGDDYVVRIPERGVLITAPADDANRVHGGSGAAQVDIAIDGESFAGTLVLQTEDNQTNKNSVNPRERELVYEVSGRLTAVSTRVRETLARQLDRIRALESAVADADADRAGLRTKMGELEQRAARDASALAGAREDLDARQGANETLRSELASASAYAADLEARANALSAQADSERLGHAAALERLESRLRTLERELETVTQRAAQIEAERDTAIESMAALEASSVAASGQATETAAKLESRINELESENAVLARRIEDTLAETQALRTRLTEREESLEGLRASTALEITALEQRNETLEADNAALAAQVAELERRLSAEASTMSQAAQ